MSDLPVTRGFVGRRRPARPDRLPPGQYDVGERWPVLSTEPTPQVSAQDWTLRVDGAVRTPSSWDWAALRALPRESVTVDLHCVTTWSRLDTRFTGVRVQTLLDAVAPEPEVTHVMAHARGGYSANLPLPDVAEARAWVVWEADGAPLAAEHGGPLRLLVPHLYLWKSTKWLDRLELMTADSPGFWERGGYHDRGDPWREQRYQGDP